jgi:hypothetical protein
MTQVKSASNAPMNGWLVAAAPSGGPLHEAPCRKRPFWTDDLHRVVSCMVRKA